MTKATRNSRNSLLAKSPLVIPDVSGMTCKEAAHAYLDAGFWPIPWRGAKVPAYPKGWSYETVKRETHARINKWRDDWQVGLITSPRSGILALDIDDKEKFNAWNMPWVGGAESETGREDGYHIVYDGRELEEWPVQGNIPGGQIKTNGFIAVEPSRHPNGNYYRWAELACIVYPVGKLGPFLAEYRNRPKSKANGTAPDPEGLWKAVLEAEDGEQRGAMFTWAADAHKRGLEDDEIVSLLWLAVREKELRSWNPRDPWTPEGIRRYAIPPDGWSHSPNGQVTDAEAQLYADVRMLQPVNGKLVVVRDIHEQRVASRVEDILVYNEARARVNARNRAPVPEPDSLDSFLDEEDESEPFRIDGLSLADSHTLVVGPFKAGKTTLRNNLVRSLADGDDFLGNEAFSISGNVGIIDLEMSKRQSRRELARQKIIHSGRIRVWHLRGQEHSFRLLDRQCRAEWADLIRSAGLGHLMLDCLAPALEANGLTESNEDIQKFLSAWGDLLRESGVTEDTVFHHMGHIGERGRGGSALRGWCDVEWKINRPNQTNGGREIDDPSGPRYFRAYGRGDVDVAEFRIGFDSSTHRLSWEDGNRYQDAMDELRDPVLKWVTENPGCTVTNAKENVSGDNTLIGRILARLAESRLICIHKKGHGSYHYSVAECPDKSAHEVQRVKTGASASAKKR